ncbi:TIGR00341 family protein [Chitinophaga caeni]|uniref:TIGR00341 family protein n=1 Tax=Chitinophaga caeni TaxID=2029983 RepID=A0A291QTX7_9BACT|nr:TIGR00341 family protein [Chitinophaga caeni]ATL47304.1 TIGR00341 family protein [Chitinophaga caeni]
MNRFLVGLRDLFNLHTDKERDAKTIESIEKNVSFKGANAWILAFAILIASIGLNINSTAVVIGAMLISPLMGPIMGAGLSLGINDFELFKRSLINLLFTTVISLITSTLYFVITPIDAAQSELLARTFPTIYDVLIAFLGGLAGIVAATRMEKGNAIPGVAIATALMPPLCTAGYGLATSQWLFFLGAFYLYLINCVFICLATLLIVKYLKFRKKEYVDEEQGRKVRRIISIIVTVMLIPSIYLAYTLVIENRYRENAAKYLEETFEENDHPILYKKINYRSDPKTIEVAVLNKVYTPEEIQANEKRMLKYGLKGTKLVMRQSDDTAFDANAFKASILQEFLKRDKTEPLSAQEQALLKVAPAAVANLYPTNNIASEANALFSEVKHLSIADHINFGADSTMKPDTLTVVTVGIDKQMPKKQQVQLEAWLQKRIQHKCVVWFRLEQ